MKPTTIDGNRVIWHGVVPEKAPYGDDPDEVAVAEISKEAGGVMICGLYHGEWLANAGNRAAVRLLLAQFAEVKRLCQSHNNPGSNPGAHKLAGDVLRILEDSE